MRLNDYAKAWIEQRPGLRPRTVDLYSWLLKRHIAPHLGDAVLSRLTTPMIRAWRAELLVNGVSPTMAAKADRLLRARSGVNVERPQRAARGRTMLTP